MVKANILSFGLKRLLGHFVSCSRVFILRNSSFPPRLLYATSLPTPRQLTTRLFWEVIPYFRPSPLFFFSDFSNSVMYLKLYVKCAVS